VLFGRNAEENMRATPDRGRLEAAINAAKVTSGATRYGPALKLAESILARSTLPRREAILISDFQRVGWSGAEDIHYGAGVRLTTVSVASAKTSNLSVPSVTFARASFSGQERITVTVGVTNKGEIEMPASIGAHPAFNWPLAGGADKCNYLVKDLGFDAAVDYKSEDVRKSLQKHCPKGIDVYFDNVGGEILDAALTQLARGARIVICGAISQYNNTTPIKGPSNYLSLLVNRASMKGMVVFDYADRYGEAAREMAGWIKTGKLKSREHIVEGLETFPDALLKLYKGENTGKLVLKVAEA